MPRSRSRGSLHEVFRVVIADDHAAVRSGLRTLLEGKGGHEVCGEAADGLEAIREAEEKQPDVVLLDVSMPRMTGLEAVRGIRRASPGSSVVMVTVDESADQIRDAFDAGAHGYVLKRDASRELLQGLDVVRRKKMFRSSGCP